MKTVELKSQKTEMKSIEGLHNRFELAKGKTSELEDRTKIIQYEEQKEK